MCGAPWRTCSRTGGRGGCPFLPAFALTAAWVVACENPEAPVACGVVPRQSVYAGETTSVRACFDDPNGDVLAYAAVSQDPGVATVAVTGDTVTVAGVSPGIAYVPVTATDPGGFSAGVRFEVVVPNRAPVPVGVIASLELAAGDSALVDVSAHFSDPDGQGLAFAAAVSDTGIATVLAAGSLVAVRAHAKGVATVSVTATDPGGMAATQHFIVTVPNRAPEPVGTMPERTVAAGETLTFELAPYFSDPDGDMLAYSASIDDATVAGVSVAGDAVSVTGLARGTTAVTVTATDTEGLAATRSFIVTVPNRAPTAVGRIPPDTIPVGETATLDPSGYFSDPDGDSLLYTAAPPDTTVLNVTDYAGSFTVTALARGAAAVTITATDAEGLSATQSFTVTVPRPPVAELGYELARTLPHDPETYTQGLLIHDSTFFESTGRYGRSEVRQVEIATGRVLRRHALSNEYFGEGLARAGDRLIQLTWRAGVAFVYDLATLEPLHTFSYEGEGWGLCHDGEALFMSNGSDTLQRRDPDTFDLLEVIGVTRDGSPVHSLNELECVGEDVYANVYRSDRIVRIDKATGEVTGELDAGALSRASGRPDHAGAVLNGIAYDEGTGTFHLTGKLWPVVFEIVTVER